LLIGAAGDTLRAVADHRNRWFTQVLVAALEEGIAGPQEILGHVTPEIMAASLPAPVLSELLTRSLTTGAMRADHVVSVLPPDLLAEHIPHPVLWGCIAEAGEEAGMATDAEAAADDPDEAAAIARRRRFLESAVASGLDYGMVSEEEVLAYVTPEVIAACMPTRLKADLLRACIEAERVDAELVVRTLGIAALAEHAPVPILWQVVVAAGRRAAGIKGASAPPPQPTPRPIPRPVRAPRPAAVKAAPARAPERELEADLDTGPLPDEDQTLVPIGDNHLSLKPNRRITGAGATSRRRVIGTGVGIEAHRAATEPGAKEIEVIDETDVHVTPSGGTNGERNK
jgi:hypothetical protein